VLDLILAELARSFPDTEEAIRVGIRLLAALLAGGIIGYQRERTGKAAGLRTHMMVSMGSAVFVLGSAEAGMANDAMSRVVQGIAAGIGFLGAGSILKLEQERSIKGLTTAAGIWMTAALGVTIGLGNLGTAAIAAILAWVVLAVLFPLEQALSNDSENA
jgi:putative Mg2+ transporter-C (MgtC) family protein